MILTVSLLALQVSCPFCTRAKTLLGGLKLPAGKEVKVFECVQFFASLESMRRLTDATRRVSRRLDQMDNGSDIQAYLAEKTGQRTVPNIFIQGKVRCKSLQYHPVFVYAPLTPILSALSSTLVARTTSPRPRPRASLPSSLRPKSAAVGCPSPVP